MNADLFFEGLSYDFVSSHSEKMPVLHAQGLAGAEFVELTNVTGCIYEYLSDEEKGWDEGDFSVFLTQEPFSVELMVGSFRKATNAAEIAAASPPAVPAHESEQESCDICMESEEYTDPDEWAECGCICSNCGKLEWVCRFTCPGCKYECRYDFLARTAATTDPTTEAK